MKKLNFTLLLVVMGYASFAQLGESTFLAGGSLQIASEPISSNSNITYYSAQPVFGYVLAADKAVGLTVAFSGSKAKYDPDMVSRTTNIEAGVFYRKYNSITEKLFFNWQIAAGILSTKSDNNGPENSSFGIGARFLPVLPGLQLINYWWFPGLGIYPTIKKRETLKGALLT